MKYNRKYGGGGDSTYSFIIEFSNNKIIIKYQKIYMNHSWWPWHKFDSGAGMKIAFSVMRHFEILRRIHAE